MTRTARTTAAFLTALLLLGFAFALNNADLVYRPDMHHPVVADSASGSDLMPVTDLGSGEGDAAARAYAESFGLAVD